MEKYFGATRSSALATGFLAACFFIAPHKFGSIVNPVGLAHFPASPIDWAIGLWPVSLPSVFAGVALVLALIAAWKQPVPAFRSNWPVVLPFATLLIATLIGLPHTTEHYAAYLFVGHMAGVMAFLLAVLTVVTQVPRSRHLFMWAAIAGALTSALYGWYQHLAGFDDTIQFLYALEAEGQHIESALWQRLLEGRVMSGFTYPNIFAAHLLLFLPIAIYWADRWGRYGDPPGVCRALFIGTVCLIMIPPLWWTGSRAASVAIAVAAIATGILVAADSKWVRRHWLKVLPVVAALCVVGGYVGFETVERLKSSERGLSSVMARLDYYNAAYDMFKEQPWTGVGLLEFFPNYMRLKPLGAEETRLPHCLFLFFLAHCGVAGGLAAILFLFQPVIMWFRKSSEAIAKSKSAFICVIAGMIAWCAHSLADFDLQVPATMMMMVTLPILVVKPAPANGNGWGYRLVCILIACAALASLAWIPGDIAYQEQSNAMADGLPAGAVLPYAEAAARSSPRSPYPWDAFGKYARNQREWKLAYDAFSKASERAPHRASMHAHLAQQCRRVNDIVTLENSLRQAAYWYPGKYGEDWEEYLRSKQENE